MSVFTQYSDCENESQYFPSGSPSSYNNISDNISTGINTTICQHVHNIDEQFREFAEIDPILQSFPNSQAVIDIMMRYSDFIQNKNQKCDGIHQNHENSHEINKVIICKTIILITILISNLITINLLRHPFHQIQQIICSIRTHFLLHSVITQKWQIWTTN